MTQTVCPARLSGCGPGGRPLGWSMAAIAAVASVGVGAALARRWLRGSGRLRLRLESGQHGRGGLVALRHGRRLDKTTVPAKNRTLVMVGPFQGGVKPLLARRGKLQYGLSYRPVDGFWSATLEALSWVGKEMETDKLVAVVSPWDKISVLVQKQFRIESLPAEKKVMAWRDNLQTEAALTEQLGQIGIRAVELRRKRVTDWKAVD